MKKQQTKTMKLVKLKRSIMPPPTKVFEDKIKKIKIPIRNTTISDQNKSIRKTKILETQSQTTS